MRGTYDNVKHDGITRRRVLHHSLVAGAGLGVTPLLSMSRAAAQSRTGGHVVILNYAYPEVWDPHLAGTLAANAAISPMYNQVVEFNPVNPQEIIGDLAKSWEVTDSGTIYTFHLHDNITWWDGKPLTADDVVFRAYPNRPDCLKVI